MMMKKRRISALFACIICFKINATERYIRLINYSKSIIGLLKKNCNVIIRKIWKKFKGISYKNEAHVKKKLLSLVAATALIAPTLSYAVGLGSVRTYSNLNERLSAEIPVLSVKKKGRISVTLASNAEFSKRGVQRAEVLNNLKFSVVKRGGRTYVRISSAKQIAVPYLNFILQLNSPEGVVSREYAIFLDPASVGKKKRSNSSKVATSPYHTSGSKAVTSSKQNTASQSIRNKSAQQRRQANLNVKISNQKSGRYGPVVKGETLWSIASQTRPSSRVAVSDMLEAIRRANPRTLASTLPAGVMLNIPTIEGYSAYSGKTTVKQTVNSQEKATTAKQMNGVTVVDKSQPLEIPNKAATTVTESTPEHPKPQPSTTNTTPSQTPTTAIEPTTDSVQQAIKTEAQKAQAQATEITTEITKTVETTVKDAVQQGEESVKSAADSALSTTESVVDSMTSGAEKITEEAKEIAENATAKLDSLGESSKIIVDSTSQPVINDEAGIEIKPDAVETGLEKVAEAITQTEKKIPEKTAEKTITQTQVEPVANTPAVNTNTPASGGIMQLVKDNMPAVGGAAAAVLGLGGLFLFKRRRKAKQAALPAVAAGIAVGHVADSETDIDELLKDLPDDFVVSDEAITPITEDTELLNTEFLTDETELELDSESEALVELQDSLDINEELELASAQATADEDLVGLGVDDLSAITTNEFTTELSDDDNSSIDFSLTEDLASNTDELVAADNTLFETPLSELDNEQDILTSNNNDNVSLDNELLDFDLSSGDTDDEVFSDVDSLVSSEADVDDKPLSELSEDLSVVEEKASTLLDFEAKSDALDVDLNNESAVDELLFEENLTASPILEGDNISKNQPLTELDEFVDLGEEEHIVEITPPVDSSDDDSEFSLNIAANDIAVTESPEEDKALAEDDASFDMILGHEDDMLIEIDEEDSNEVITEFTVSKDSVDGLLDVSDSNTPNASIAADGFVDGTQRSATAEDWFKGTESADEDVLIDFEHVENDELVSIGGNEAVNSELANASAMAAQESLTPEAVSRMQMKLDLANSFISISESTRAENLLLEIIQNGSEEQVEIAQNLLNTLKG